MSMAQNSAALNALDRENGLRLEIVADPDPESPRQWSNLGVMVCHHSRRSLGDSDGFEKAKEVIREHYADQFLDQYDLSSPEDVYRLLGECSEVIMLPLFVYEHSGITMRTGPFGDRWDSGQVGYIFVTKDTIRREYGWKRLSPARVAKVKHYLKGEVEVYDQYLTGDVWGFRTFDVAGEEVDSCWGFFGSDPTTNGIADHLDTPYLELAKTGQYERRYSL